jgi:uncharacterized Zn-finger protein
MSNSLGNSEVLYVNTRKVTCNGLKEKSRSDSGHPLIYLEISKSDSVTCPYCSKFFVYKKSRNDKK